jgi:hypothetical protein
MDDAPQEEFDEKPNPSAATPAAVATAPTATVVAFTTAGPRVGNGWKQAENGQKENPLAVARRSHRFSSVTGFDREFEI